MKLIALPAALLFAFVTGGCQSPSTQTPASTRAAVVTPADLPEPPPPTRGTPSDADAKAVEPAATELARRADAGDKAFIAKLMGGGAANDAAAADMIERIKRADVGKTFRTHLAVRSPETAGLNYHDPSHFQVDLKKDAAGRWEVARLWLCR
jgi:hypothetical protein